MSNRQTLAAIGCLILAGTLAADPKPNVILVMADDLGYGDVGFNGNTVIHTPHLDAMAEDGLTFTRFYAAAPVCSPTRGSCLTGRHPFRYGVTGANAGHMPPAEHTLAELLKRQGYVTGHFGKWHLGTLTTEINDSNRGGPRGKAHYSPPWKNGFDVCFSTEAKVPTFDPMVKPRAGARQTWWHPVTDPEQAAEYGTRYWDHDGKAVTDNLSGDDSRVIMDRAIPFIRDAAAKEPPFFAVIWFHAPHLPVVGGPKHTALYADHDPYARHYYGCITALDEQVGRLRIELRKLGVESHTMLWFCADNGPEGQAGKAPGSAGRFRGRKRDLFEGGVRVPAALVWPDRVDAGTETAFPAVTSDYLPTVLAALNTEYPDDRPLDGVDLLPAIDGERGERDKPIGFRHGRNAAWVTHRHKLIQVGGNWMLFDLIADPAEKRDIAAGHPDVVSRMKADLTRWDESLGEGR